MVVSREDVRRVAALARLELSDGEVERLASELDAILGHVEALDLEHRASDIEHRPSAGEPPSAAGDGDRGPAVLRGDEPGADPLSGGPETFAPEFRGGFITVPRLASHDVDGG